VVVAAGGQALAVEAPSEEGDLLLVTLQAVVDLELAVSRL